MASLTVQLGRVKATNTRLAAYASNLDDNGSVEAFASRLEKLEANWSEFISVLDQINSSAEPYDETTTESLIVEFENKYYNTREVLTRSLKTYAVSNAPNDQSRLFETQTKFLDKLSHLNILTSEAQLPKISIKPFSGDYCDWKSFHDLFVSSVHNSTKLTASQKFHYLKSFLVNEPATLLKHIAITDDNYAEAWDKLTTRYNKLGRIAYSFVSKFMQLPSIIQLTANDLRPFTDTVDEILRGLRALNPKAESRDVWLIHILLNKLDASTQQTWAEYILSSPNIQDSEFPTIGEFTTFLEHRCSSLEVNHRVTKSKLNNRSSSSPNKSRSSHHNNRSQADSTTNQFKAFQASNLYCPKCKSNHTLSTCQQFLTLSIPDRRSFICSQDLCLNCLRSGHKSSTCKSSFNCRKCHKRHHTLIHPISSNNTNRSFNHQNQNSLLVNPANSGNSLATMSSLPGPSHVVNHYSTQTVAQRSVTLLPTALADVIEASGQKQTCRILLDSGSQLSFISEACMKRLGLPRQHARIPVSGLASFEAGTTKGLVNIKLLSRINGQFIKVNSYILKTITWNLPTNTFNLDKFEIYQSLSLADPNFNVASPVDILLGADQFFKVLRNNSIVGVDGNPDALLTLFGWVIGGDISNFEPYSDNENSLSHTVVSLHTYHDVDVALQRFWELEAVQSSPIMTSDEQRTDDHFISTHTRAVDGKYMVELPFKTDKPIEFGNSLNAAIRRQKSMERKFMSNQQLHERYAQFMNEYLQMGHMTRLHTPHISSTDCYYLPHNAVFKADSTTSKLRVVFDGSSKHGMNTSLNENLLVGPPIQRELFSTCIRFRRHQYALTCNIEKMFRQIWVAEKHRSFQRIIWRSSSAEPLQHFQLNTVTYGTSCAPYLSVRVLKQLALDNIDQFPNIVQILLNDFYVDDVMTGADTIDNLFDIKTQLSSLLQSAGFPLRKWSTNCWPLLASIPDDQRELSPLELSDDTSIKVLGLRWYPTRDCYSYKVSLPDHAKITKRNILSDASRIFDPLGFLAPSVIVIKILFQQLWLLNLQWDDAVPDDVRKQWSTLRNEVVQFEKINISRCIWETSSDIQFHAFCDASEKAFSAVIYCRSLHNERVQIELLAAKTKVAPLKQISLPRLELCGAVLLCNNSTN